MSDLVERLRTVTGFIRWETGDRIAASVCLSEEAADRIEELQTDIRDLTEDFNDCYEQRLIWKKRAEKAERTLGLCEDQRREWEHHCKAAETKLEMAVEALEISKEYIEDAAEGICYVCHGDCSSKGLPQMGCPMAEYQSDLNKIRTVLKELEDKGDGC